MDTMQAIAMGEAHRLDVPKIFDWEKAAHLLVEHKAVNAMAGLSEDWEWTGGAILVGGKIVPKIDTYTFLGSTWATPVLVIEDTEYDCWIKGDNNPHNWGSDTYWPPEARAIFDKKEEVEEETKEIKK